MKKDKSSLIYLAINRKNVYEINNFRPIFMKISLFQRKKHFLHTSKVFNMRLNEKSIPRIEGKAPWGANQKSQQPEPAQ